MWQRNLLKVACSEYTLNSHIIQHCPLLLSPWVASSCWMWYRNSRSLRDVVNSWRSPDFHLSSWTPPCSWSTNLKPSAKPVIFTQPNPMLLHLRPPFALFYPHDHTPMSRRKLRPPCKITCLASSLPPYPLTSLLHPSLSWSKEVSWSGLNLPPEPHGAHLPPPPRGPHSISFVWFLEKPFTPVRHPTQLSHLKATKRT